MVRPCRRGTGEASAGSVVVRWSHSECVASRRAGRATPGSEIRGGRKGAVTDVARDAAGRADSFHCDCATPPCNESEFRETNQLFVKRIGFSCNEFAGLRMIRPKWEVGFPVRTKRTLHSSVRSFSATLSRAFAARKLWMNLPAGW